MLVRSIWLRNVSDGLHGTSSITLVAELSFYCRITSHIALFSVVQMPYVRVYEFHSASSAFDDVLSVVEGNRESFTKPSASSCSPRKFEATNGSRPTGSLDRHQQSSAASEMYPAFQMTTMWSSTWGPQSSTSRRIRVSFWASAQLAAVAEELIRHHRLRDDRWHSGATSGFIVFLWGRSGSLMPTVLRLMSHIALFLRVLSVLWDVQAPSPVRSLGRKVSLRPLRSRPRSWDYM